MQLFSGKVGQGYSKFIRFPFINQLNCDNHPFFEGLHVLSTSAKAFYDNVLSPKGCFQGLTRKSFRKVFLVDVLDIGT